MRFVKASVLDIASIEILPDSRNADESMLL